MLNRFDTFHTFFFHRYSLQASVLSNIQQYVCNGCSTYRIIACSCNSFKDDWLRTWCQVCKYTNLQSVKIGIGMISRGEVALIVATKGMSMGLMKDEFFAPLVLVVVATTIVTPILLKLAYKYQASREADVPMASSLVDKVEERNDLEKITQNAANMHEEMKEIHK